MYIYTYVNMYMYISIYAYYMQKTRFICERTCTYIIGGKLDIYIYICVCGEPLILLVGHWPQLQGTTRFASSPHDD